MGKLNYFNYCALIIMTVLIITVVARHMLKGRRNRYFWNLLLVVFWCTIFEIIAVNLDNGTGSNVLEKYVAHGGQLILQNLAVAVYVIYLACLTDSMHKLKENVRLELLLALPMVIVIALVLTSPLTHKIFYLNEQYQYTHGPWYNLLYLSSAFYIAVGVVYALRCRKQFAKGQLWAMLAIFPIMLAALGVQLICPGLRVEMFAHAIGVLFTLIMVQRPEERTDSSTGFGKPTAYATDIEQAIGNRKPIYIILINILNYKSLRDVLGYESSNVLMNMVAAKILNICGSQLPKADPYYLDRGRFALVTGKENAGRVDAVAETLSAMLREDLLVQDMEINLQANLCILRCPEDLSDFQSIYAFSNEFEEYNKVGKVLYAEEILKDGRYIIKDIEDIIQNAMDHERLSVYYQPIYSVQEGRFASAEALLRLDDEEYGHISPELFIPVAEKNGVIHRIGTMVLEEVCRFIASDEFKELGLDYIEVNLSVTQCMRSNLAKEILQMFEKYHVRPEQINLEITETAAANSQNMMTENVRVLAEAGVPFSLDDYGTGYSNICRVTSLPLEIVKLDKSFTELEENPKLEVVVRNTVKMVKEMNMKIVVEGIETEEMAKKFSDLQCEYIQGFYYSKPLPREEFVSFLRQAKKRS
jgi:EAL domain-containing protein (putative c-di-GMP-specific phosphodiesterase class I)/GGDEF domain-containing protein